MTAAEAKNAKRITKKQKAVLDFIAQTIEKTGIAPTVRDICVGLGLSSPSTVHVHLKTLEEKGYIHRDPLKSRCITVVGQERSASPRPDADKRAARRRRGVFQYRLIACGRKRRRRPSYTRRTKRHRDNPPSDGDRRRLQLVPSEGTRRLHGGDRH